MYIKNSSKLQEINDTDVKSIIPSHWSIFLGGTKHKLLLFIENKCRISGARTIHHASAAKELGVSERLVKRYISDMKNAGLISIQYVHIKTKKSISGSNQTRIFFNKEKIEELDLVFSQLLPFVDKYKRNRSYSISNILVNIPENYVWDEAICNDLCDRKVSKLIKKIKIQKQNINPEKDAYPIDNIDLWQNASPCNENKDSVSKNEENKENGLSIGNNSSFLKQEKTNEILKKLYHIEILSKWQFASPCSELNKYIKLYGKILNSCEFGITNEDLLSFLKCRNYRNRKNCNYPIEIISKWQFASPWSGAYPYIDLLYIYILNLIYILISVYMLLLRKSEAGFGKPTFIGKNNFDLGFDSIPNLDFNKNNLELKEESRSIDFVSVSKIKKKKKYNLKRTIPAPKAIAGTPRRISMGMSGAERGVHSILNLNMQNEAQKHMKGFVRRVPKENEKSEMTKNILDKFCKKSPKLRFSENEKFVDYWNALTEAHSKAPACRKMHKNEISKSFQMALTFFHEWKNGKIFTSSKRFCFTSEYLGQSGIYEISKRKITDDQIFHFLYKAIHAYDEKDRNDLPSSFSKFLYCEYTKYGQDHATGTSKFLEVLVQKEGSNLEKRTKNAYLSLPNDVQSAIDRYIAPALNKIRERSLDEDPPYDEILDLCVSVEMAYDLYNKKYAYLIERNELLESMTYGGSFVGFMGSFSEYMETINWKEIPVKVLFNPSGKYFGMFLHKFSGEF